MGDISKEARLLVAKLIWQRVGDLVLMVGEGVGRLGRGGDGLSPCGPTGQATPETSKATCVRMAN